MPGSAMPRPATEITPGAPDGAPATLPRASNRRGWAVTVGDDDLGPRVTSDGRFLLFSSNRPGGIGGYSIWAAPRASAGGGWGTLFNLGPSVNSEYDDYSPAPTPDGKRLFFATNRKA